MTNIDIRPLTASIGAEIQGVDLREPLSDTMVEQIEDALLDHLVLFFRDQQVSPAEHKAFASRFGTPTVHPFVPNLGEGLEEIQVLDYDGSGPRNTFADRWHHDVTFEPEPPLGSILSAQQLPPVGGDTLWANMYDAYDALSARMQHMLDDLVAVHDWLQAGRVFGPTIMTSESLDDVRKKYPLTKHPLVRVHPVTKRKLLFVNSTWTSHVDDLTTSESNTILEFVYRHCQSPDFQVRFHWEPGSIAFWDNRVAQHYAVADYSERRVMHRVTLAGDAPY